MFSIEYQIQGFSVASGPPTKAIACAYAAKQLELMQAQRAKLENDDQLLQQQYKEQIEAESEAPLPADWLTEFREFYPRIELDSNLVFTYDKLATSQAITRLYTQAFSPLSSILV